MATREEIYKRFEELDKRASLGEVDKIEKQHGQGKMTARERIEMLLDKGTFNELDKLVTHRCTDFGMEKKQIPGDGVVSGYGKVDGRIVFVYAYDFTAHGGSPDGHERFLLVITYEVGNSAPAAVHMCPAQLFLVHHLVGHGLYHVGTRDEHVAALFHHKDEVGQCR